MTNLDELFKQSDEKERCPHIRQDNISPYCSNGLKKGESIGEKRRRICEESSLRNYCLFNARYRFCVYFMGGSI